MARPTVIAPTTIRALDLSYGLTRGRDHDGHGLYAVVFDNGVKFGISGDLRDRLRTYFRPWSRPVSDVLVLRCRRGDLVHAEKLIMKLWPDDMGQIVRGTRCGEFVFGIGSIEARGSLETVCSELISDV